MQELSSFLKRINYPLFIFVLLGLRFSLVSSNIADSLYLIAFLGYSAYISFLKSKESTAKTPDEKIKEIETMVNNIALKNQVRPTQEQNVKRYF